MKGLFIVARALLGIVGATLLVLGIVFWTGHGASLVPLHMGLGFLFVLLLWIVAGFAAAARAPRGLVVTTFVWGLLLPVVGIGQLRFMPGPSHWVIQVVHLLVGIVGMGLGGALSARVARGRGHAPAALPTAAPPRPAP